MVCLGASGSRAPRDCQSVHVPQAWAAHDYLFKDDRVTFFDEPQGIHDCFRRYTQHKHRAPKLWADAWLLAFAECAGGAVITFDRALAARADHTVLLA